MMAITGATGARGAGGVDERARRRPRLGAFSDGPRANGPVLSRAQFAGRGAHPVPAIRVARDLLSPVKHFFIMRPGGAAVWSWLPGDASRHTGFAVSRARTGS